MKSNCMKKSLLIFDFDGTIADTLVVAVKILNELACDFNLPQVSKEQFVDLKNKSVPELIKISGMSWLQLPLFIKRARDRFKKHLNLVNPIVGMPEILLALNQRGYRMGIVTSNTREGVQAFLKKHQMPLRFFEFIQAPDSLFGKGKVLREIVKQNNLNVDEVVMIGDEVRDLEAAQKAGVDSIAVTWGFNSEQLLQSHKPDYLVRDPKDLYELIESM